MNTIRICSGCQKPLEANAPDGLCPECLLKAGLGTGVDLGPDSQAESGRTSFVAPPLGEVARLFPQLEILGFIGQGGMGAVYKARQKALDRIVALKILPPGIGKDPAFAERFTREAKALTLVGEEGPPALNRRILVRSHLNLNQNSLSDTRPGQPCVLVKTHLGLGADFPRTLCS